MRTDAGCGLQCVGWLGSYKVNNIQIVQLFFWKYLNTLLRRPRECLFLTYLNLTLHVSLALSSVHTFFETKVLSISIKPNSHITHIQIPREAKWNAGNCKSKIVSDWFSDYQQMDNILSSCSCFTLRPRLFGLDPSVKGFCMKTIDCSLSGLINWEWDSTWTVFLHNNSPHLLKKSWCNRMQRYRQ